MDDIVLIDKPTGMTSFGVVARVRRVLTEQAGRKVKVGHTGTLDPFATGLMILVTGKKCREAEHYTKLDKWYEAQIVLGQTSSTGDPEGELAAVSDRRPTEAEIGAVLERFTGEIQQVPPVFSAIKIDGQRAYKLARQGKEVNMPSRNVTIYSLELISYEYPHMNIRTHVSSGTYIRTLAQDIGEALGTGAYCRELRRTKIAEYDIADAKTLADLGIVS
jgi:tRNA pseudouridine55 synthase